MEDGLTLLRATLRERYGSAVRGTIPIAATDIPRPCYAPCPMAPANDLRERVATFIRAASPLPMCPVCIASRLDVSGNGVRRAMRLLVSAVEPEFVVEHRVCYACRMRTKVVSVLRK